MRTLAAVLTLALAACGGKATPPPSSPPSAVAPVAPVAAKTLVNVDDEGVGVNGFDPMGYATDGKAVPGVGDHAVPHGGATYWFASAEHQAAFTADPAKASGIDSAVKTLGAAPFGKFLLLLAAVGLAAYGAYGFVRARHADM